MKKLPTCSNSSGTPLRPDLGRAELEGESVNRTKTRVCLITAGHWSAVMGGIQYQVKCLVEQMIRDGGFEIFYLARLVDPFYRPKGYTMVPIAGNDRSLKKVFIQDAPKVFRLLKAIDPDVIYQKGLNSYTGIGAYYARSNPCPFIFHIASDYDVTPLNKQKVSWHRGLAWVEKKIGEYGLKSADWIVAQTEGQQRLLHRHYGMKASLLIPNFHPFPKEPIQKHHPPIKVIWVANFKPVKRPEMFVRLAEDLGDEVNARFIMIGRPGDAKHYHKLHARIAGTKNLTYLGELPIDRVNEILSGSHIFVNTSIVEGFPNTFIQAWMRKMPVVTAGVDPDGILEGEGLGFSNASYGHLRDAVRRLIHDDRLRERTGERAQAYAFRRFSTANVAPLLDLMKKTPPKGPSNLNTEVQEFSH